MKRVFAAAVLCAAAAVAAAAAQDSDTIHARVWSSAENTRLVIESEQRLPYSVSDIDGPPRLLIDIRAAAADPEIINRLPPPMEAYLTTVRAAQYNAQTMRVVFDLAAAIHYRVHRIAPVGRYRHRLVIDISPQTPPADPLLLLLERLEKEEQAHGKPFVVLIDPGHGGEDPGAVSPNNRYEKNLVLRISRRLAETINRLPGMKALLTRDSDRFIALFERVHIAHRLHADAFVSIHADSVKNRKARGSSVFILSKKGASTKFARRLAQQANLSDLIGGQPDTHDPLLETALREFSKDGKDRASRLLAQLILERLRDVNTLHSETIESAGFAVLKSPSIPSVLVETAFISNAEEEKKLLSDEFQQQLVNALAEALDTYRKTYHVNR